MFCIYVPGAWDPGNATPQFRRAMMFNVQCIAVYLIVAQIEKVVVQRMRPGGVVQAGQG